jgi:histone-lysine N-methyltransferase SETMAR
MTMLGPLTARSTLATVQDLSFECLPHPPYSPDLDPSDFHVFGLFKKAMGCKSFRSDDSRRRMSGCALNQNTFFLEVCMHFRSAGIIVWYAMETTQKNEVIVYLLCSINYEIKNI